jgi:hypothetical protein
VIGHTGVLQPTRRGTVTGLLAVLPTLVWGDAVLAALAVGVRRVVPGPLPVEWLAAVAVLAPVSYLFGGAVLFRAWRRSPGGSATAAVDDPRARWAVRWLHGRRGLHVFLLISVVGGSIGAACLYAGGRHPRTVTLARLSAVVFAAFWSTVYLGVFAWLF